MLGIIGVFGGTVGMGRRVKRGVRGGGVVTGGMMGGILGGEIVVGIYGAEGELYERDVVGVCAAAEGGRERRNS